jgi:hypothetical protein
MVRLANTPYKRPFKRRRLTPKQREAVIELANGGTFKSGAEKFGVTLDGFHERIQCARRRYQAKSLTQLVALACASGDITLDDLDDPRPSQDEEATA